MAKHKSGNQMQNKYNGNINDNGQEGSEHSINWRETEREGEHCRTSEKNYSMSNLIDVWAIPWKELQPEKSLSITGPARKNTTRVTLSRIGET